MEKPEGGHVPPLPHFMDALTNQLFIIIITQQQRYTLDLHILNEYFSGWVLIIINRYIY